jgi:ankyrin repeat protein
MAASRPAVRRLPARPSAERLRKLAKQLAKAEGLRLAAAQRRLARDHGYASWAELIREAEARARPPRSALSLAAARADEDEVRRLLDEGAAVDGEPHEWDTPLFLACDSDAPAPARLAVATRLIEAGAFVRRGCTGGATALHAAARRGPAELVERLLRSGALFWQPDSNGRRAHDYATEGDPIDRDRILYLTAEGPRIEDPDFRAAVAAIHAGDGDALARLLDARPELLHMRAIEPDIGTRGYFSDPKLFWFVANNPTLIPRPPANIVEIARLMIDRGVGQADLDYTLELVMTDAAMPRDLQIDLVSTLVEAGAQAGEQALLTTLGHRQTRPVEWLLERGLEPSAAVAAGLGRLDALPALLARASPEQRSDALAMAVINGQREAARLCLEAGADPDRFMPCHRHSTPLHQAALDGDVETMKLLVAHGARRDIEDRLWHGTPLGWALHGKQEEAAAWLRGLD